MKCIFGLSTTTQDCIGIDDKKIGKDIDFPESIDVLIEMPGFIEYYSALDNMRSLASIKNKTGKEEVITLLNRVGLDSYEKKHIRKYSLEMIHKLEIAMSLLDKPDVVILDELFNALDKKSVINVKNIILLLKEENRFVIISSHDESLLEEITDKIYEIEEGKIVESVKKWCKYLK